jgi:hypothetical protein
MAVQNSLYVTLKSIRAIDGIVEYCRRTYQDPEQYCLRILRQEGERRADMYKIGAIAASELLLRFSDQELSGIRLFAESEGDIAWPEVPDDWSEEAALANPELEAKIQAAEGQLMAYQSVKGLLKRIGESPVVRLDDEELVAGMQLLVALGLLAADRVETILLYKRPEV